MKRFALLDNNYDIKGDNHPQADGCKDYLRDGLEEAGEANEIFPLPPDTESASDSVLADLLPVDRVGETMCFSMGERIDTLWSGDFSFEDILTNKVKLRQKSLKFSKQRSNQLNDKIQSQKQSQMIKVWIRSHLVT